MLNQFREHIEIVFPEMLKEHFLLACSGGVDSMVLAHLCMALKLDFSLAHCNFQLRGESSREDAELVEKIGKLYDINFYEKQFDTIGYINENKVSLQVAARNLRYTWFADLMKDKQIDYLVTAHHADDNLETFFINLLRGSGLKGLIGMPEKSSHLFRPLLPFPREQIIAYAKENKVEWREDSSNAEEKYLRNKLRHQVVPLLKEINPTLLDSFSNTLKYLTQSSEIANDRITYLKNKLFVQKDGVIKIKISELSKLSPLEGYIYHLFEPYGFKEVGELMQLMQGLTGKELRSRSHRLVRDRQFLLLASINENKNRTHEIGVQVTTIFEPFTMKIKEVDAVGDFDEDVLYVDKQTLKYPLVLRKWNQGDYFYPFGLKGKKKLSKFFKDEKMNVLEKEQQWLLCSGQAIVWVVGRRSDERFKVSDKTKEILKFELN